MKRFSKPTPNELVFGFIYFLLQLLVIPGIIVAVDMMLPAALPEAVLNFIVFAINFLAVLVIFWKFLRANWQVVRRQPWAALRWAGIGLAIYMAGSFLFGWIVPQIDPDFANINDAAIMEMVQGHFTLMSVGTVFLVPIAEECFYRGLIFRGLYDRFPVLAYLLSMSFFSLAHVLGYVVLADWQTLVISFFQYLPASFALAWSYRKSGSIFVPVLIHMSVNQMGMLLMR